MRTNALLVSAVLALGGSAFAQTTVSKNIVGYVNKSLPAGKFVLISNPLNNGGNTVAEVIKVPGDLTLYHFDGTKYTPSVFSGGEAIDGETIVIKPGGGFFAKADADTTITFVGEVAVGGTVDIKPGLSVVSSVLPQAGKLGDLEFPTAADLTVYQFANNKYTPSDLSGGEWLTADPKGPAVDVAEAFFISVDKAAAKQTWTRTFTIQ
jgi:hypothetical protein